MKEAKGPCYRFDGVEIDVQNLRVTVDSEVRPLEPKSFRLLLYLLEHPGRALPKDEIMAAVWPDAFVSDNSLARAITQIRKALNDDPKVPRYVETVPTVGYRFLGECKQDLEPAAGLDVLAPNGPPLAGPRSAARWGRSQWLLGIGSCLGLALAIWLCVVLVQRRASTGYLLHVVSVAKLTSYPGDEREPAISPDGSLVAFSWSGAAGDNYDIYVVKSGGQQPLRLTHDPASDSFPAWSPDGSQIAFLRRKGPFAEILVVPPLGGPERALHCFPLIGADLDFSQHPVLSWSHDGRSIVYSGQSNAGGKYQLFLLSVETGAVRALSSPDRSSAGDSSPALSEDGKFLAYVRYLAPRNGRVFLQPLDPGIVPRGNPAEVPTSGLALRSPVWLEDGKQLLFADATHIFQWDRSRGTLPIYLADGALGGMSLGPKVTGTARQLVVAFEKVDFDIWSVPLNAKGTKATGPPQVLLLSTQDDSHPDYSPDGRSVAFCSGRSGSGEIWVADADGGNPRQLTHLGARLVSYPKWSPDGTQIAFHARVPEVAEIYVVDVDRGGARQITHEDPGLALATWSNDQRFIYASTLVGGTGTTYRIPLNGGPIERLWEGALVRETANGKYVLYWKTNAPGIFRRSLEGDLAKNPEQLLVPDFWPLKQLGGYAPVAGGIYYVGGDAQGKPGAFRYFDYASGRSTEVAPAVPGLGRGFTVAPDRRHLAFTASTEIGGDLLSLGLQ
jgi:Tol biopolymer transport system component/DNA-binding winged helix-turn-helix (wHTH) protein